MGACCTGFLFRRFLFASGPLGGWVFGGLGFGFWALLFYLHSRLVQMIQSLLGSLDLAHMGSFEKLYTNPSTTPIKLADIH